MTDTTEKLPLVYCFFDTNLLLEYKTYDEVDWPKILNAKDVCLVLAPVVIAELDKHKINYNNLRIQQRARDLAPKLIRHLEQGLTDGKLPEVRPHVTLMGLYKEPFFDNWRSEELDPAVPDDRLIASALLFSRQHPTENVVILAADNGVRLKAQSRNLKALKPPAEVRREDPPPPEKKQIKELQQKLQQYENRMPDLKVAFYEKGKYINEIFFSRKGEWRWGAPEEYARRKIRAEREMLELMLANANSTVPRAEIEEFKAKYEKYLRDLENPLKMEFVKNFAPYCQLELVVMNEGTAPANGILAYIDFPKGSSVLFVDSPEDLELETDLPEKPETPEWAKLPVPLSLVDLINSMAIVRESIWLPNLNPMNIYPSLLGSSKQRYDAGSFPFGENSIAREYEKLGHLRKKYIPVVIYLPKSAYDGFTIIYEIIAEEFPTPVKGELNVRWKKYGINSSL